MFRLLRPREVFEDGLETGYRYAPQLTNDLCQQWIELLNESEEFTAYGAWDRSLLQRIILNTALPGGVILVQDANDQVVACLSLCSRRARVATVMYVLVRRDHRGRGLGGAMMRRGLNVALSASARRVELLTDSKRHPALKLYLQHGFLPDLQASRDAEEVWTRVFQETFNPPGNKSEVIALRAGREKRAGRSGAIVWHPGRTSAEVTVRKPV